MTDNLNADYDARENAWHSDVKALTENGLDRYDAYREANKLEQERMQEQGLER